jgi:thioesterase domain-containing protein/acyl carrier protein
MFPFREVANFQTVARTPLSRAMVVVQNADDISFQLPGIQSEKIPAFNHAVQYDLSLEVNVEGAGLRARLMYRKVLFQPETVQRLADKLVAILQEMLAHPENEVERIGTDRLPIKRGVSLATRPPYVAPRTDLEHKLAQIWQDVLELDDVGIHDGFFELGGQSLLALRLFTRIEQETGTHLPLATLFGTTTIAHLAQLIEGRSDSSSWDCLVPIQPNGTKTPFFCVHGIGGGVIGYRDLANFIGEEQPFFGLQAVGQDGSMPYDLSIEAMASRYVDVMRSQQPNGPYRIGGYCFGGVVAFEMARQLEKLGEHVSVLAIFEGGMADTMDTRVSLFERMRAIWRNLPVWLKDYSGMSSGQLWNRMRSTLDKLSIKFGRNPEAQRRARVEETLDINVDDLPQRNVELTDLHLKAALEYKPPAYSGNLTLFRARNRSINEIVFGSLDPKMGWGAFAKEVKVIPVDGFHRNMHLAPYARSLAHELKKELDNDLR